MQNLNSKVCQLANGLVGMGFSRKEAFKKAWKLKTQTGDIRILSFWKKDGSFNKRVVATNISDYKTEFPGPTKNPYPKYVDLVKFEAGVEPFIIAPIPKNVISLV